MCEIDFDVKLNETLKCL